ANVHLAFTLDDNAVTTIKKGQSAKSVPGPDESIQTFETSKDLDARATLNRLRPLMRRLHVFPAPDTLPERTFYLKGITANLKVNDALVLSSAGSDPQLWRVKQSTPNPTDDVTAVNVEKYFRPAPSQADVALTDVQAKATAYQNNPQLGIK